MNLNVKSPYMLNKYLLFAPKTIKHLSPAKLRLAFGCPTPITAKIRNNTLNWQATDTTGTKRQVKRNNTKTISEKLSFTIYQMTQKTAFYNPRSLKISDPLSKSAM